MNRSDGTIIVAHRIPQHVTPVDQWLAEVAHRVVLLTAAEVAPGYAGKFGSVVGFPEYLSPDLSSRIDAIAASEPVAAIVHGTEDDLLRLARARDRHAVPGPSAETLLPFRDKLLMKSGLPAEVGIPRFQGLSGPDDAHEFVKQVGWPVVVKPRLGYASRGVEVFGGWPSLAEHVSGLENSDDFLIEEFVTGDSYHVDGFMRGGEIEVAIPSRYINTCLDFGRGESLGSVQIDDIDPLATDLNNFAEQVIRAMPPTEFSPFHLEVFVTAEGDIVFGEVAARIGGGRIYESLSSALQLDPVALWFRSQAGLNSTVPEFTRSPTRGGFLLVPPIRGRLEQVASAPLPRGVVAATLPEGVPRSFDAADATTDTVASFVVEGESAAEVRNVIRSCQIWMEEQYRWIQ